ncbi:MAG: sigma-54-dependent Fis family transcriptional regulator [Rhodospirillales bacterium]|nr:sigma-54-dependent Fis family transcriptional regulator [Rhodospirillales bacterium]
MRLLILGSLAGPLGAASRIAIGRGAKVLHVESIEAALRLLRAGESVDLLLADVRFDVAGLIVALQSERMTLPVVACGIGSDTRLAVAAIRAGAREYLPLPPDPEMIGAMLALVSQESHPIVHADARTAAMLALAAKIAASEATVLIVGPSGTGKELMARFIHARSRRANARFVAVNCAAIPEALLESELFGHEKGAFTGAIARRIGRFEEANGGTLLLDEISEMDSRLQAKLLRAVQEREIDRVGGTQPVKVNVRILATSNRNLEEEVARGRFRADLYFRLNVVSLQLPPLAERPKDIPVLARHFCEKYAELNSVGNKELTPEALAALAAHAWPGNVRELENTIHRAVLLAPGSRIGTESILLSSSAAVGASRGAIGANGLADRSAGASPGGGLVGRTVADVERDLIVETLNHCLGNRTHAATILGISIRTLRNKLKQYVEEGVPVPAPGEGRDALDHAAF